MKTVKEAIKARDEFLEKHPKYISCQKQLDELLDGCEDYFSRMNFISALMVSKLSELSYQFEILKQKSKELSNCVE